MPQRKDEFHATWNTRQVLRADVQDERNAKNVGHYIIIAMALPQCRAMRMSQEHNLGSQKAHGTVVGGRLAQVQSTATSAFDDPCGKLDRSSESHLDEGQMAVIAENSVCFRCSVPLLWSRRPTIGWMCDRCLYGELQQVMLLRQIVATLGFVSQRTVQRSPRS